MVAECMTKHKGIWYLPGEDIPEETVPKGPGLPQTGVLWWPVPILACCGMGLFVIGWARRRQDGAGNE